MHFILATTLLVAVVYAKGKPSPLPAGLSFYSDTACTVRSTIVFGEYPIVLNDLCQPFANFAGANSVAITTCPPGACTCQMYTSTDCTGTAATLGSPTGTLGAACAVDLGFLSAACRDFAN